MKRKCVRPLLCATLVLGMCCAHALAQGHDAAASAVIQELQRFYAGEPICERVGVQVKVPPSSPGGTARMARASYIIRWRAMGDSGGGSTASLELGQYLLDATSSTLTMAHLRDSGTYFRRPLEELSVHGLSRALPPIPLPQIDLALGSADTTGGGVCREFWPYAREIAWKSVETDARQINRRTVRGECAGGTVTLALTGPRMRMLTIDRTDAKVTITLAFTALSACDTSKPLIDVERRTAVASLGDLRARGGSVRVGEALPEMALSPASGGEWSVADLIESPPEAVIVGVPPAEHAVLVFTRVLPPGTMPSLAKVDFDALGRWLRSSRAAGFSVRPGSGGAELGDQPPRFGYARVLVFANPSPDEVLPVVTASGEQWGMRNVLFVNTPATTLDVIAPGADGAVVIVDSRAVVRSVLAITPSTTTEQLGDQIAGALFEVGAPRGMSVFVAPAPMQELIEIPGP